MAKFPRAATAARPARPARPARKRRNAYHHGNLRQALLDQAVATIRERGVDALTLREVGAQLRVSRTALYRHFADKDALLAAVATEGFRAFRTALAAPWDASGHTPEGFTAQGRAYVAFAMANPSHYRVMFGGFVAGPDCDPELRSAAAAAFMVLVDAIATLQAQGRVRGGDPRLLALFAWSTVHGLSTLVIDGQLARPGTTPDDVIAATVDRIWDGLAAPPAAE